eukprot:84710-Hanusia_phi.AAC.3
MHTVHKHQEVAASRLQADTGVPAATLPRKRGRGQAVQAAREDYKGCFISGTLNFLNGEAVHGVNESYSYQAFCARISDIEDL